MSQSRSNDSWWLERPLDPGPKLAQSLAHALTNVENAVKRSAGASELSTKISTTFTAFFTSQFLNGGSVLSKTGTIDQEEMRRSLEICFLPESEFRKGQLPSVLFYRSDWNAVMIGAINWSDPFFIGVLMHELGHAYQKKMGARYSNFSQEWFEEEVAMHELEAHVLDHLTTNSYTKTLATVYDRHSQAPAVTEFMAVVSARDLLELDRAIGVHENGYDVRGVACTEHIVMLGFTFLDKRHGEMKDKVNHYRWIIGK
ncbi:MAG: hypothetical protein ABI430_03915 [Candidatus Taylorbacteria bacterium]